jgi:hypothetical protein
MGINPAGYFAAWKVAGIWSSLPPPIQGGIFLLERLPRVSPAAAGSALGFIPAAFQAADEIA